MAEGRDNATIAATLVITERAVSKHIGNVFLKLGLPPADSLAYVSDWLLTGAIVAADSSPELGGAK